MSMLVYSLGVFDAEQRVGWFAHCPVLLHNPIFPVGAVWFLHSTCGPGWVKMSWAGSKQQSGALILNVGHDVSTNTLLKVFLHLRLAWSCSLSWKIQVGSECPGSFLSQVGWSHVLPVRLTWNQNPSFHLPTAVILTYLFQLSAFFISSCWEDQVDTFFWIICCWIVGFYCILDALSLWTSELLQRLKILSLDSCSFGRYCICRKIARKHSKFYIL